MRPYYSTTATSATMASGRTLPLGGTVADNAEASGAARAQLLDFLAGRD